MIKEQVRQIIRGRIIELKRRQRDIDNDTLKCYYQGGMDALGACILRIDVADDQGK